ncbi:endonuclease/exonuclease/phosphatase family protein [Microvirga sp. 2TAF3]|uniref:endonuclease/exonuclease/phosphatase family protein n=1 Tax=Microvirga sp. 2TAF3 TaxID=3233014 RepID=UPI003F9C9D46
MRPLISMLVQDLPAPDSATLAEARQPPATRERHDRFLQDIGAFHGIEYRPPSHPLAWPGRLRLAAFNAERLKYREAARALLDRAGAHVALFSEVDLGMARSGNGHPLRELIGAAGEGYVYGVEFVELDLGDAREMREHAGEHNARGFHGNAIVTKLALAEPRLIPLEESGFWFPGRDGAQRRVGGRMALAARVADAPRPLWLVSAHLESKTDAADRQAQIQTLLRALDKLAPDAACIIGGDFNTKDLPHGGEEQQVWLEAPERYEPLFDDLRGAGFEWVAANVAAPTQRTGPSHKPEPPFGKLDWIVVRGMKAERPQVLAALDGQGRPISDHDMITVDLSF